MGVEQLSDGHYTRRRVIEGEEDEDEDEDEDELRVLAVMESKNRKGQKPERASEQQQWNVIG